MSIRSWNSLSTRWKTALHAGFFLTLALLFLAVVMLRPENFLAAGWDYQSHQFFLKTFLRDSFRAGELPLWIPYICAGRPFAADPQAGVFYPLHLLYAVLPVPSALTVLVFLHISAAGYFCFRLGREIGLSGFAARLSGVIYMFNGFLVTRAYRGQSERLEALAYLPLILFFLERAEKTKRLRWYLWAGAAGALQFLAGAPQIAWLTWVAAGAYLLTRRVLDWRRGGWRSLTRTVARGLIALIVTCGIAAVQLVPTAELVRQSNRSRASVEFSAAFSFPPENAVHFLFPNYNVHPEVGSFLNDAESAGYVGLLGLVLAWLGLLRSRSPYKWAFGVPAVLAVMIMLGRDTPVFGFLYYVLPGLRAFRIPARALAILTLCLSLCAGLGADAVWHDVRHRVSRRVGIALALTIFVLMFTIALDMANLLGKPWTQVPALRSAFVLGLLALGALLLAGLLGRTRTQVLWLVLVCAEMFFVYGHMDIYRIVEKQAYRPPPAEAGILAAVRDDEGRFRFSLPRHMVRENCGVLCRRSGVNGFVALSLDSYYRFVHAMTYQPVPDEFTHTPSEDVFNLDNRFPFKVLNVRYSMGRDPETGVPELVSRDDCVPRAFFVSRFQVIPDQDALLETMQDPQFDPRDMVLLQEDPGVSFSPGLEDARNRVEITEYQPNRIRVTADLESDGFLVLSEIDYPGWRAYADGREVPIHRADYLIRAIPLRAGHYEHIELRYQPRSFRVGLAITIVTCVGFVCVLVLDRLRCRPATHLQEAVEEVRSAPVSSRWTGIGAWAQIVAIVLVGFTLPRLLRTPCALAWTYMAENLEEKGELEEAASLARRAVQLAPDQYLAHYQMGIILGRQGRLSESVHHFRRALELNPDVSRAGNNLGFVLLRLGRLDESIEASRRAAETDAHSGKAQFNWAVALAAKGRLEEAGKHFLLARQLSAGEPGVYLETSTVWLRHQRYAEAIEVLREGRARLPDNLAIIDALAWQLANCPQDELRNPTEAVTLAERACRETAHSDPNLLRTLAVACAEAGRISRALDVARRAQGLAVRAGKQELADQLADWMRRWEH